MSEMSCPRCGGSHPPGAAACPGPSLTGRTLADGIQIRQRLAETKHGSVYQAVETRTGTEVELITLRRESSWTMSPGDTTEVDGLWEQLSRARGINHPNLAAIKGMGMLPEGPRYVALEVLKGELLSQMIDARGAVALDEAVQLIHQAATGLQAAHERGVLHGGLSPDSILVTRTVDDRPLVKVIRFGASPQSDYSAPEQLAGQRGDHRSDIFGLGAVLFHLVTGVPPGAGSGNIALIAEPVRSVVSKALDPLPERRYGTVAAFARALVGTRQAPPEPEERSDGRGRRVAAVAAVAAGLGILSAGVWLLSGPQQSRPEATLEPQTTVGMAAPTAQDAAPSSGRSTMPPTPSQRSRRDGAVESTSRAGARAATRAAGATPIREAGPTAEPEPAPTQGPGDSVLGYAPEEAIGDAATPPAPSLTGTPAMRLALGDVTRLDIVVDYREVRPGRLVLIVGDGYHTSTSLEYNLGKLYAAYLGFLDYPTQSPVMELWRDGKKLGEYTRHGLITASE